MAVVKMAGARHDENGKYKNGKAGDQTGKEVAESKFVMHKRGWYALRPKDPEVALKIAEAMKEACANDNIGYDQNNRYDIITKLKKYGSLKAIKAKCECVCSTLVRACIIQATGIDVGKFLTNAEADVLEKFGLFEKRFAVKSASDLRVGDILVTMGKETGHTEIVTEGKKREVEKVGYKLKTNLAKRINYGAKRATSKIKYIVIHFTANDGDTDENNGKYFKNNTVYASAHYFVDDDSVTQSVPDNYIAYSVGGSKYPSCKVTGGGTLYGKCTNANSISIELCDDVKNGTIYPSKGTIENAIALTKKLMKKYGIPASRVIRHFDVTGKSCPAYWCGTYSKNRKWKTEFHDKLTEKAEEPKKETSEKEFQPYVVKVTAKTLNVRAAAGTKNKKVGEITTKENLIKKNPDYYFKNVPYTIVEEKTVSGHKWGKLKSGAGWISLQYTKRA